MACRQYKHGSFRDFADVVTPESSLTLHWPGRPALKLLAFDDGRQGLRDLALGHALLECCEAGQAPRLERVEGNEYHLAPQAVAPVGTNAAALPLRLDPELILKSMADFIHAAGRWDETGCFHRAALFDVALQCFIHSVEDIGRHNCIDRIAGHCLVQGLQPAGLGLFVSARTTGSLAAKIVRAGFRLIVSRSAVTTAGIHSAAAAGATLVGFARTDRFTVFTDSAQRFGD